MQQRGFSSSTTLIIFLNIILGSTLYPNLPKNYFRLVYFLCCNSIVSCFLAGVQTDLAICTFPLKLNYKISFHGFI
jgi:hypothetical protein